MFSLATSSALFAISLGASYLTGSAAYGDTCNSNFVSYWGSNSYGAIYPDTANWQKRLSFYCQDNSIDVIPIAFLNVFSSTGGLPQIDLANTCNSTIAPYFPGSQLLDCSFLAADIQTCQAAGKKVTISLGGAGGGGSGADAAFADQIWNLFLGGSSSTRPFGAAVLDGVDLDIEGGTNSYVPFVNQLRTHFTGASKKYYVTAAPQCPYPDAYLGASLNGAIFDAVYVQFYNNACAVTKYGTSAWNFGTWDYWANRISPNKNIKVYLGVPASTTAAGSGYVPPSTLAPIIQTLRSSFPSFGGVMIWDASQAVANANFQVSVKNTLTSGGSCAAFKYPACSAPAWSASGTYPTGSTVTYDSYIWQARYYGSGTPTASDTGSWVPISACGGAATAPTTTTTTAKVTTTTSKATTTSTKATTTAKTTTTSAASGGSCAGVAAWSSTTVYVGGNFATYQGQLWEASWWTEGDIPGGSAGVWVAKGSC